jgi:hypothetical protein
MLTRRKSIKAANATTLKFITDTLRERAENQYDRGVRKNTLTIMIAQE